MIEKLNFRIAGTAPLIMHNGQMADPANEWTRAVKEISGKRKKTEADYEEMARLEWMGALYLQDGCPCIPGYVFEAALIGRGGAARKQKMGKQAAAGLYVTKNFPLIYKGANEPSELWLDERFRFSVPVKVGQARIIRTRPIFSKWSAYIEVEFDPQLINADDIRLWIEVAGYEVGLMDWRPKYGRFSVVWDVK